MAIVKLQKGEEFRGQLFYCDRKDGQYGPQVQLKFKGKTDRWDLLYLDESNVEKLNRLGILGSPDDKGAYPVKGRPNLRIIWPANMPKTDLEVKMDGQTPVNSRGDGGQGREPSAITFQRLKTTMGHCLDFAKQAWAWLPDGHHSEAVAATAHTLFIQCVHMNCLAPGPVEKHTPQQAEEMDQLQLTLQWKNEEMEAWVQKNFNAKAHDLSKTQAAKAIQELLKVIEEKQARQQEQMANPPQEEIPW